jgi:hypothetical protein
MLNELLLTSEKRQTLSKLGIGDKATECLLTCKYDELYTLNPELAGEATYSVYNYLHRVFVGLSSKLIGDVSYLEYIPGFIDNFLKLQTEKSVGFDQTEILILALHGLFGMFLKENWTGKSYLFVNAEIWYQEERVFKNDPEYIEKYNAKMNNIDCASLPKEWLDLAAASKLSVGDLNGATFAVYKDKEFVKGCHPLIFAEHMVINGEECYHSLKLINYYLLIKQACQVATSPHPEPNHARFGRPVLLPSRARGSVGLPPRADDDLPDGGAQENCDGQLRVRVFEVSLGFKQI